MRASRSPSRRPDEISAAMGSRESVWISCSRGPKAFLRSASSSVNITVSVRRLPYTSVTCVSAWAASTLAAMESTGVIPDPAATRPWCVPGRSSGVNAPDGGATSSSSPATSRSTSHSENKPSVTRRTPTRGAAPACAQIEYERRSSTPSRTVRSVRYCPGRNAKADRRCSGTSNVTATASSHSRSTPATRRVWKPVRAGASASVIRSPSRARTARGRPCSGGARCRRWGRSATALPCPATRSAGRPRARAACRG